MTKSPAKSTLVHHRRCVQCLCGAIVALAVVTIAAASPPPPAEARPLASHLLQATLDFNTLRVYGYPVTSNPARPPYGNWPATAGVNAGTAPFTGRIAEDPPYSDLAGPFDPFSAEAPEMDFVTWNPAWISERLGETALQDAWPGLDGVDEVSAGARIRAGSIDASEKVWLRHWYEPQHLDKDLNADGRLTDLDNNGVPDAPVNPTPTNIDEWYPAIMTEYTYMLVDNDPLPSSDANAGNLYRSAPRPVCGTVGGTEFVFPIGVAEGALDPAGPGIGTGLTSLDADFDGQIDPVVVSDEATLPTTIGGAVLDLDGDGALDTIDPDGLPRSCDELAVLHTEALTLEQGGYVQFLDHFLYLESLTESAATVQVWYNGDLLPVRIQTISVGIGAVLLAGDRGPVLVVPPGGNNTGTLPPGPWFAYLQDADPSNRTATLVLGRGLGAACASMEYQPNVANRRPGGPAFLKRFYVDGVEYNVVAVGTCGRNQFQYLTLRSPLPKVSVILEQHSVRLQPFASLTYLPLLPPFNYEHTILEDVRALSDFGDVDVPPGTFPPIVPRPPVRYMGGPIGPVSPVLPFTEPLPYRGRNPAAPVGPYDDVRAARWFYVTEATNPQMLGVLMEKYGDDSPPALDLVFANLSQANRYCAGDGTGDFACRDMSADQDPSAGLAIDDFNNDGDPDVIFANDGVANQICLGNGHGGFTCRAAWPVALASFDVDAGDFDGDGRPDAVFANANVGSSVCLGDGTGSFDCRTVTGPGRSSLGVAVGDLDGDGDLDFVLANDGQANQACLQRDDGSVTFDCLDVQATSQTSWAVAVGDVNGDGHPDAVFANVGQPNHVCLGDGLGAFACHNVDAATWPSLGVALGDVNGDGLLDAVFATDGQRNRLCLGDGSGGFSCSVLDPAINQSFGVALGDLNHDGFLDAAFATVGQPSRVCFGDGSGGFTCRDVYDDVRRAWDVGIANFDRRLRSPQGAFFYNEQVWSLPYHYTEFALPDLPESPALPPEYDGDKYYVTSAFTDPTARWRRWTMPDTPLPAVIPPPPPDLTVNRTPDGGYPLGAPRRASLWFDPDEPSDRPVKLWTDETGVRLYGGQPERSGWPCDNRRPALSSGAGDHSVATDAASAEIGAAYPVEVFPYTDPWAPFNPQHAHAPPGDSLTVNPAYMDEFRNFGEELSDLYGQIVIDGQNAREKVYHRLWYEPVYTSKIRFAESCARDLRFPAVMQEYTYLFMDTTDTPQAAAPGSSRFAFPVGTSASELPRPEPGGVLPPGGEFGYGLTTFDPDFDGDHDAVTLHSERTLATFLDAQWQSHRPSLPGFPLPPVPGPVLDFDGDGLLDNLDADGVALNGNELVVFALESLTLDLDPATPAGPSAMFLDHMVVLENVTRGSRGQFRFWFTGGNSVNARPEPIGGLRSLQIGDAAIVDRFQSRVTIVSPGNSNPGVDGAWFVFLEDVSPDADRVTVTIGRALGATHSAIDDGRGAHDMVPGDPWYLKRFYVDGHEYNVVAIMTRPATPTGGSLFEFITLRTPVPKGNVMNAQDSLFLQGYYLGDLPSQLSVLPPFNVQHTIAEDILRLAATSFANTREYTGCVGELRPFPPLVEEVVAEAVEPRLGAQLEEILRPSPENPGWQTDQSIAIPNQYTDIRVSEGQRYLLTTSWTSRVSRLHFYGCLRSGPPPFPPGVPALTHDQIAAIARSWGVPVNRLIPWANETNPPQPLPVTIPGLPPIIAPYYDARLGGPWVRLKLFYDPLEDIDLYGNTAAVTLPDVLPPEPTATSAAPTATVEPPTATATPSATETPTPPPTATPTGGLNWNVQCTVVSPYRIRVDWTDQTTFETEFVVEVSVNGMAFAPIDVVPSTTQATTGTAYSYTPPVDLPASTSFRFRIVARNPSTGESMGPSEPSGECRTQGSMTTGCIQGRLYVQGRSRHGDVLIRVDGIPVGYTNYDGYFCLCNIHTGKHTVLASLPGYLTTEATHAYVPAGGTLTLPYSAMRGGDANRDNRVDLFDLVLVSSTYGTVPPADLRADINADGRIDLFDLVLVSANYGSIGPIPWGHAMLGSSEQSVAQPPLSLDGAVGPWTGDYAASYRIERLDEDSLVVDVVAHDVRDLWGAEIRLSFDPEQLELVDSLEAPGIQVQPGEAWSREGSSYVAVNSGDNVQGTATFVASRLNPAPPLNGDVVIVSATFRLLRGEAQDAVRIQHALLVDRWANEIRVRWQGTELFPETAPTALIHRVWLPSVWLQHELP